MSWSQVVSAEKSYLMTGKRVFGPKMGVILLDSKLSLLHTSACQTEGTEGCSSVLVTLEQ